MRLPEGTEPRTSLKITTLYPNTHTRFAVANVHFYQTEDQRLAQANALLGALSTVPLPVVIAGDFNSRPDSPVMSLFAGDWNVPDKGQDRLTFSSKHPRWEIDYIMYRPTEHFTVTDIDVIDEPLVSDHRPVVLDLQVNP